MKVLKATETQYKSLNGYTNGNKRIEFTKDNKSRWIIGKGVLTDNAFLAIRKELEKLLLINFDPLVVND